MQRIYESIQVFKLDFPLKPSPDKINLNDPIYLVGSCFSNEIGALLTYNKFRNLSNPLGTVYNPYSIFKIIRRELNTTNLVENSGVYYHWDAHGEVAALQKTKTIEKLENRLTASEVFLNQSNWLIITLGTAWVYRLRETNQIVANCHKMPNTQFTRELLSVEQITDSFNTTKDFLGQINPSIKIILTVSPVRHTRDGLMENNRSKARLLEAVHQLAETYDRVYYFPSYEIVIDELRDYRFFAEDFVHPSKQAVGYVWKRFSETFFDAETHDFLTKWGKVAAALDHKPFQPHSGEHQKFLKATLKNLEELNDKVDLRVEIAQIKTQII